MLRNSRSWDGSTSFLTHVDLTQKEILSVHQYTSNMSLQVPETTDFIASNMEKDTIHDNDMANGGAYKETPETTNLFSVNEDDEPLTEVTWPPLKEHKKVMLYQWTGLPKKPSFLKKKKKGDKEEEKALISNKKKREDACPGVSHDKMSRLDHLMESVTRRSSKTTVSKVVSCPVVGNLPEKRQGPEWAEEVSGRKNLELFEQLHMEETSQTEREMEYLHLLPKAEQHQITRVQLEKRNQLISTEIAHLQLCQKFLEQKQSHLRHLLYLVNGEVDEEDTAPQSVAGPLNPSTHLTSRQESATNACTVMAPCSYDRDLCSVFLETSSLDGGIPITGSLDRKCCNTEPLMKEINAVKNGQDLLEKECLHLGSRFHTDNNIITELLREQHQRHSQLLVNMNDLQEQQHAEIVDMKKVIHFMEEIMAYQSCEQARDIRDELGLFQSRLSKIETEQKVQNSPVSVNEANRMQILHSKVMNLLSTIATNTSQILYQPNTLPVIVTFLLICLSAVSIHATPLITAPLHTITPLIIGVLSCVVLHKWSPVSFALQRSWVVTRVSRLFNRLINDYDFMSAIEQTLEQFVGG